MWLKIVFFCVFGCSYTLTASFALDGVLSGNKMAGVPLGRALGDGELDVEGVCTEPGVTCQNCTHSVTCILLPVGYLKVPLQACDDGQTCNAHLGKCTTQHVPECEEVSYEYKHTCEQVGIFPDAHDCRKFHLCSPPESTPFGRPADHRTAFCPKNYGYNPQTAQCSIKLHKGQCNSKLVPECKEVGQNGVLSSSPNHYYVCLMKKGSLYPQVFLCPHGWIFINGFCHSDPPTNQAKPEKPKNKNGSSDEVDNKIKDVKESDSKKTKGNDLLIVGKEEEKPTTSRMEGFFSTDKPITYAPDAFLADKFDLTNYESTDDVAPPDNTVYDFANSFENGNEFW